MAIEQRAEALPLSVRGQVLRSGDAEFEVARHIWNGMIDRRPDIIVRAAGAADVVAAVELAREANLPLAVRGGGHSAAGSSVTDGGLMLDLSLMKGVRVDPARRIARAQAGLTWGVFDAETLAFGLATPGVIV
jgi:FAD/FMN-containing dehydrogenase